jgi:hypothetical protein
MELVTASYVVTHYLFSSSSGRPVSQISIRRQASGYLSFFRYVFRCSSATRFESIGTAASNQLVIPATDNELIWRVGVLLTGRLLEKTFPCRCFQFL